MDDYLATPQILERLKLERDKLISRVQQIPAALHEKRTDPSRWSIAEVLEHLVRVEIGVTKLLTLRGQQAPPPGTVASAEAVQLTPEISAIARDRSRGIEAPERVRPSGSVSSTDSLIQLAATRAAFLDAFASGNPDALDVITHPHPVFGQMTLRSWFAFAADHDARHSDQIAEIAQQIG